MKKKTPAKKVKTTKSRARPRPAKFKLPVRSLKSRGRKTPHSVLSRAEQNPIISPKHISYWESKATFNPSAIFGGGEIHLIYRAIGAGDVSVFGHATSRTGLSIDTRSRTPAYVQRSYADRSKPITISYSSGGGTSGGTEDPRLTLIGDRVYMLYTSFDGWNSIRIALTSISLDDFVHERWNWSPYVFISPPNQINKNWVLFPEKINGKYAILHGISPEILIDYVDDLKEFDGTKFIQSKPPSGGRPDSWDNWIRGAGPAPIKTKKGWLVLYHAMDINDPNRYKLGAMLLDLKDLTKIVAVSKLPILEPDELYENQGFKSGVIYACGAVVVDGWLFVYYGGADMVACVATAELDPLVNSIISGKSVKLRKNSGNRRISSLPH